MAEERRKSKSTRRERLESAPLFTHDKVFQIVRERLPSGSVLDIPCGSGSFTKRLIHMGYHAIGADLVQHSAMIETAFQSMDMNQQFPFEDAFFDAVVCIEGIEHIERPFDFVRECARVVRPEGYLIITTPNISSIRSRWRWFLTGFHNKCKYPLDESRPQPRHHISMKSFPELRYILHTNRFRIENVFTNRIKPISYLYLLWVPVQFLASRLILVRGAVSADHAAITHQVIRQMNSIPMLFGENIIVVARRINREAVEQR